MSESPIGPRDGAPLVSVLCICGDHARFVGECLRSLDAQTWRPLEVLLLDNASQDDSRAEIEKWASQTSLPHQILWQKTKEGVCRNFNQLFALAQGDSFNLLAADDAFLPQKIERQVSIMQQSGPGVGVVYGDALRVDEEGQPLPGLFVETHRQRSDLPSGDIFGEMIKANWIPAHGALVRRSAWEKCGPWDESLVYEDWDMWIRLAHDFTFAIDPEPHSICRVVATSLTRSVLHQDVLPTRLSVARIKARTSAFSRLSGTTECLRLLAGAVEGAAHILTHHAVSADVFSDLHERSGEPVFAETAQSWPTGGFAPPTKPDPHREVLARSLIDRAKEIRADLANQRQAERTGSKGTDSKSDETNSLVRRLKALFQRR